MSVQSTPAATEKRDLLRLLICGSVDDGKSTLLGRMLYDAGAMEQDVLDTLERDSKKHGTTGGDIDPALLTDGLKAEREQGITIDVAYRYFESPKRSFIIADCPGHTQYTRNMVTGASHSSLAIILVDAARGITEQTRRHSFISSLLGVRHMIIAINKMDMIGFEEDVFNKLKEEFEEFSSRLNISDINFIPLSALKGDNVVNKSTNMPWYGGSTLLNFLETVHIASDKNLIDFRFPVQLVNRPSPDYRGYCGTIASGVVRKGEEILVLPAQTRSRIKTIETFDGETEEAYAGQAVTLRLEDEIDVSRGEMIVPTKNVPSVRDETEAMIVWMSEEPLELNRGYIVQHTSRSAVGKVESIRYRMDMGTLHRQQSTGLKLNDIGRCLIKFDQPLFTDSYQKNRTTGSFIFIDRLTNNTVGAGIILDKASQELEDHWAEEPKESLAEYKSSITPAERTKLQNVKPVTVLITGPSGAGKTSLAYELEKRLFESGYNSTVLDGENIRRGLSRDLGFSGQERSENARRIAETAALFNQAGLICFCSLMAPSDAVRQRIKELVGAKQFILVHLKKDQPDSSEVNYESPKDADLTLDMEELGLEECASQVVEILMKRGVFIPPS